MVVAHQDVEALVDAGRVGEFLVRVPGGQRRNGGVEGGRVAEAGVLVAGGERAGDAAHRAAARDRRALQNGSARRFSSGRILRAAFTFGPAMWQCMSTPPGMTTRPRGVDLAVGRAAGSLGAATILPSAIHRSRTSPSMPLAGS